MTNELNSGKNLNKEEKDIVDGSYLSETAKISEKKPRASECINSPLPATAATAVEKADPLIALINPRSRL